MRLILLVIFVASVTNAQSPPGTLLFTTSKQGAYTYRKYSLEVTTIRLIFLFYQLFPFQSINLTQLMLQYQKKGSMYALVILLIFAKVLGFHTQI